MSEITGLHHISLIVADTKRVLGFYQGVLGLLLKGDNSHTTKMEKVNEKKNGTDSGDDAFSFALPGKNKLLSLTYCL